MYDYQNKPAKETSQIDSPASEISIHRRTVPIQDPGLEEERRNCLAILDEAISKLQNKNLSADTKNKIREIFEGSTSQSKIKTSRFKDELLLRFEYMRRRLSSARFFYNKDYSAYSPTTTAYVHSQETSNIAINITNYYIEQMGTPFNLMTLLHEVSHFSDIKRKPKWDKLYRESGTEDYFYASDPMTDDTQEYIQKSIAGLGKFYNKMNDIEYSKSIGRPKGLSRLKTALNNADHIALLALNLGKEKVKEAQYIDFSKRHPIVQRIIKEQQARREARRNAGN
ncbi:hypothetical protein AAEY27_12085 [Kosakonia sp. BYX6]|uniref:Lysine-specific metallo-endopeptidase domain-containing protein n=1 Tax=Kosakonia calanthes TaxID=3139408 RepID=A0ABZ3AZQ7_9ENTR